MHVDVPYLFPRIAVSYRTRVAACIVAPYSAIYPRTDLSFARFLSRRTSISFEEFEAEGLPGIKTQDANTRYRTKYWTCSLSAFYRAFVCTLYVRMRHVLCCGYYDFLRHTGSPTCACTHVSWQQIYHRIHVQPIYYSIYRGERISLSIRTCLEP